MASVARVLGVLCMILALAVAGLGVYGFVEGVNASSPSEDLNTLTREMLGIYLLAALTSALVLATIGATAVVAAQAADRSGQDRRRPVAVSSAYLAPQPPSPQSAPIPVTQPPSPQSWAPPSEPPQLPPDDQQHASGPRWGPPSDLPRR